MIFEFLPNFRKKKIENKNFELLLNKFRNYYFRNNFLESSKRFLEWKMLSFVRLFCFFFCHGNGISRNMDLGSRTSILRPGRGRKGRRRVLCMRRTSSQVVRWASYIFRFGLSAYGMEIHVIRGSLHLRLSFFLIRLYNSVGRSGSWELQGLLAAPDAYIA